jgi:uncharacterized protein (TIGR02147 family)
MKKSIDLFDYHDYRLFLRDWFDHARENQSLSIRDIAEKCELSTGYLPMILSGQRNLSEKSLLKLQNVLKMNQEQLAYFKSLMDLSDSVTQSERLKSFEDIKKSRSYRKKSPKEVEIFKYLSSWLNVAIRELAFRRDFESDPEWIQKRLVQKVSTRDISEATQFLISHGFLVKNQHGQFMPGEKHLDCFTGVYRLSLGEFHKQMFGLAAQSIDLTPRDQRNLLGHTFLIPENQIESVKMILDETLAKLQKLGSEFREPGPVYHVILSTFPVAKKG